MVASPRQGMTASQRQRSLGQLMFQKRARGERALPRPVPTQSVPAAFLRHIADQGCHPSSLTHKMSSSPTNQSGGLEILTWGHLCGRFLPPTGHPPDSSCLGRVPVSDPRVPCWRDTGRHFFKNSITTYTQKLDNPLQSEHTHMTTAQNEK